MVQRYFEKFPLTVFGNTALVDITKRVVILDSVQNNPYVFYPYELESGERAEQFSDRYYNDSFKSWIVYLSNKIIDPYYGWYLDAEEFSDFIVGKYGTMYNALNKASFYRNDWFDKEKISISYYNSLPKTVLKYWKPNYDATNKVSSYSRVTTDWKINTNKICMYNVSNNQFTNNEICTITFDNNNIGKGQVLQIANGVVYIQHLSGTFLADNIVTNIIANSNIVGLESGVNTIFNAATLVISNLLPEEEIYWKPVYYFDYENEKNEFNKTIKVLDSDLSGIVSNNLRDLLDK